MPLARRKRQGHRGVFVGTRRVHLGGQSAARVTRSMVRAVFWVLRRGGDGRECWCCRQTEGWRR
jgi:hypothetical protein